MICTAAIRLASEVEGGRGSAGLVLRAEELRVDSGMGIVVPEGLICTGVDVVGVVKGGVVVVAWLPCKAIALRPWFRSSTNFACPVSCDTALSDDSELGDNVRPTGSFRAQSWITLPSFGLSIDTAQTT
jgi:hypothetical protein